VEKGAGLSGNFVQYCTGHSTIVAAEQIGRGEEKDSFF
jgi:hypothetical protein